MSAAAICVEAVPVHQTGRPKTLDTNAIYSFVSLPGQFLAGDYFFTGRPIQNRRNLSVPTLAKFISTFQPATPAESRPSMVPEDGFYRSALWCGKESPEENSPTAGNCGSPVAPFGGQSGFCRSNVPVYRPRNQTRNRGERPGNLTMSAYRSHGWLHRQNANLPNRFVLAYPQSNIVLRPRHPNQ